MWNLTKQTEWVECLNYFYSVQLTTALAVNLTLESIFLFELLQLLWIILWNGQRILWRGLCSSQKSHISYHVPYRHLQVRGKESNPSTNSIHQFHPLIEFRRVSGRNCPFRAECCLFYRVSWFWLVCFDLLQVPDVRLWERCRGLRTLDVSVHRNWARVR